MSAARKDITAAPRHATRSMAWILLRESLQAALANIVARPQRSALSVLGVAVGVASVVAVVSLVQGLSQSIANQFLSIGGSTLTVRADTPLQDVLNGRHYRLTLSDLEHLRRRLDGVRHVTPVLEVNSREGPQQIRYGAAVGAGRVLGTVNSYQDVQQAYPRYGRFLTPSDDRFRRRVAVLGDKLRRDLKLPADPTGRHITVSGEWFRVVGVIEPRGELFGISQDDYVLIPFSTAMAINGGAGDPDISIHIAVVDLESMNSVQQHVTARLRERHGLTAGQSDDFLVESSTSLLKSFNDISLTITLVVSGVVGVSLLVGGIGIMNIMLISVTERTREIGITKALGAPGHYILAQFLLEAVMLSVLGGGAGAICGYSLAWTIGRVIPDFPSTTLPWGATAGALAFAVLVGIVFGIAPARRAARLQTVDALRHE
ncbi:MAG: ABC transporter permease [Burkholderiales bacterium]|jgi:putative ABC transport system permease protein|nr:ABC transporter permease [Burkholderiales bacterium]